MTSSYQFHKFRGDGTAPQGAPFMRRRQPGRYLASPDLVTAVNTALAAEQPLLVTGDPGTGKTSLAEAVAYELGLGDVLEFSTRSDHQARDLLYTFDHVRRFYDSNVLKEPGQLEPAKYLKDGPLGVAIRSKTQRVVLVDEIDKAPRDFPNDLLNAIERMVLEIPETSERVFARHRPIVIITSNSERQLPEPFLRRCVFHHIEFPQGKEGEAQLLGILKERLQSEFPEMEALAQAALQRFLQLKQQYDDDLRKRPATGELLSWVRVLLRAGHKAEDLKTGPLPYLGALLKLEADLKLVRDSSGVPSLTQPPSGNTQATSRA